MTERTDLLLDLVLLLDEERSYVRTESDFDAGRRAALLTVSAIVTSLLLTEVESMPNNWASS